MSETVAETAAAAENDEQEDDSMETLQVEEEDEKNISAEDLLGGKSLMMSDSENEEISEAKDSKLTSKSRRQRLLDSDEEEEEAKSLQEKEGDQAEAQISPKSRRQRLPDSEPEDEGEREKAEEQISPKASGQRFPDIDEEDEEDMAPKTKPKKKISAIIDTDSEEEPQMPQEEDKPKQRHKLAKKKKQRMDSDSDSHEESQKEPSDAETSPPKNKLKGLVDSESEPEPGNESGEEQENPTEVPAEKPKKAKAVRASAKKALDSMQAIQSEQQRLHREAHISVPYHQPKPRTLKEFLSRRTINTPLATALAGGSPMPSRQPRKSMGLRMNREELEAYAKLMDDRAKEATEFFKSESEGEDENGSDDNEASVEMKDNPGVMVEAVADIPDIIDEVEKQAEETTAEEIIEAFPMQEQEEEEPVASTSAAAAALRFAEISEFLPQPEVEAQAPTKECLITEVVELPKLDLSKLTTTPPSKPATPRISEAIRRLKIEKSTDVSPSLKGDATMVIDLETGDMFAKKPTGVDDLLQRLMKTREAKKHKTTETVNILSTAHGKLEMSKVNIHLHEEEPVQKDATPGAAYVKMQEQLKSRITQKRMEDLRKKQAEEEERAAEDDEEEAMDVDEDEEYEPDEKPCPTQVNINEDEEIVEEGEETAEEAEAEEDLLQLDDEVEELAPDSESEEDSEPEEENPAAKKRNRIIKAFQGDDNSDEDDLDLLQTPKPPSNATPMTATQLQLSAHKLFDAETRRTASDEENELLDLCSGQFPQSQMVSSAAPSTDTALISQIPMTQFGMVSSQAPEELESLCSGTFATQQPTQQPTQQTEQPEEDSRTQQIANKIVSSDEETKEEELLATEKPRNKKLTKKKPKKRALGFSDDEESEGEGEDYGEEEEEEPLGSDAELVEEIPETFVDYDSEENEIVVEMNKKDRKLRASNFLEKEAELSESEWGSADEDEQNLDTYDIELGDEDQFDREKLRSELGQIHARKMLDQDIREVRQIKEMLFEDDEGAVRQRQFRWKNVDSGFSLEDQQRTETGEANEGSGDEENEHMWRKIRYEREQLLLENGLKAEAATPLSPAVANTSNSIHKLNIITARKTTVEVKKSSPFLISKVTTGKQQKSTVRGSFLVRDSETLNKLAGMTKGGAGHADGTAGTVSVKTAKAKNFVFATLTEEEHENQKRKAADLLNSSSETGVNFIKKPRLEPRREKCLIDQLL